MVMLKKQLFIISLLFGVISSAMAADPVKLYGQLQVSGNQLCSEQGEPVVLRGVSYGWHNLWPRFIIKIGKVAERGLEMHRIARCDGNLHRR